MIKRRKIAKFSFGLILFALNPNTAVAKPDKVDGYCKGSGCEVVAIDSVRVLKSGPDGSLKAYFYVYGFEYTDDAYVPLKSKEIEWGDTLNVQWAYCSKTTPLIMEYSGEGASHNLSVSIINDDVPFGALVTTTKIWNYVCSEIADELNVDVKKLEILESQINSPFDVFDQK